MEELGIPVEREKYQVYRSLPGAAYLRVLEDGTGEAVPLTPYVYSGTAKDLEAELVFDRTSAAGGCSQREQRARMAGFSGKLVLTYENSFSFACEAKRAGALGVLTIWHADLAHHGTLGGVWGTPEPEDLVWHYPGIPFAEIGKSAGGSFPAPCQWRGSREGRKNLYLSPAIMIPGMRGPRITEWPTPP